MLLYLEVGKFNQIINKEYHLWRTKDGILNFLLLPKQ